MRFSREGLWPGLVSGSDTGASAGGGASSVFSSDGMEDERWTGSMCSGSGSGSGFGSDAGSGVFGLGSGVGVRGFSGSDSRGGSAG